LSHKQASYQKNRLKQDSEEELMKIVKSKRKLKQSISSYSLFVVSIEYKFYITEKESLFRIEWKTKLFL